MSNAIDPASRGALSKNPKNVKTFMVKIEEHFQGSFKGNANILMTKIMQVKYDVCDSVWEHILKMIDMSNKMNDLECPLSNPYVIHYVTMSLPLVFGRLIIIQVTRSRLWLNLLQNWAKKRKGWWSIMTEILLLPSKVIILVMINPVESFLARKGRGKSHMNLPKKLPKKMPLMKRMVPSASIVRNMGT
jgi:hypothetical protein